ncbi:MAG: hypothetical protein N3A72_00940 [bacterium]|nr:hypothetical protein [bacterium]
MNIAKMFGSKASYFYLGVVAIISCLFGVILPGKWFLPLLNTLGIYPLYVYNLKEQRYTRGFIQMLLWAGVMSITVILLTYYFNPTIHAKILRGEAYRNEMFSWIRTGVGEESSPSQFIPKQLMHFILFSLLTILTGGFAALFFGAVLLNYMNFYVGSLFLHTTNPFLTILFSWQPWAIVRVVGYIATAIGLSELFYSYVLNRQQRIEIIKKYCIWGVGLISLDLLLKTLLAPTWQKVLQKIISGF